ncbi:MAG: sugar phosphate nucleotidyltransferase, partial [Bacteroidota bacterium]|nr:sugar phosphate nucleotidyltransferase [Bacteroidota bacterium]
FVESQDALLTLGITPNRPETGYGYIQVNGNKNVSGIKNLNRVKTFTEKPDLSMSKVFLESGDFYWNAGIFIWSLASILKAFEIYLPDIHALFTEGVDLFNTPKEEEFIYKIYSECKNISVDYGIMEKASNVFVLCSDFGWSDLGTWGSLYNYLPKDPKGNSLSGDNVFAYDLKKCIVNITSNKLAVLQGLEDFIIVETEDTLLVCKKQDEQKIKQFVTEVKLKKGDQYI